MVKCYLINVHSLHTVFCTKLCLLIAVRILTTIILILLGCAQQIVNQELFLDFVFHFNSFRISD